MERPEIYTYLNYRTFLRDMFQYCKEKNQKFSYRYFSAKAGFASPNFIKLVMEGERNIANGSVSKVAKGFSLKKKEREFFENLVAMNQAETHDEKNHYYQKLMAMKGTVAMGKIEKAEYDYFTKWYYPVIREMALMGDQSLSPEKLARQLIPPITQSQASKAIEDLVRLDLIRKNGDDTWMVKDKTISTGAEVRSLVIANFHKEMIGLAATAIDRFPAAARDISSITISIKAANIPELKQRIANFRKEILQFSDNEPDPDQVVQLNFQLFPLTNKL